jgi:hypothetical protein
MEATPRAALQRRPGSRRLMRGIAIPALGAGLIATVAFMLEEEDRDRFAKRCRVAGGEVLHDGLDRQVACVRPGSVIEL